jgi:hypothetical protein
MTEFDTFWAAYPRKTAKFDAMKAYAKARTLASAEEINDGVARYIKGKPEYADWCHPATFLNKGRWMDEWDAPAVKVYDPNYCQHEPSCHNRVWHAAKVENEKAS